MEFGLEFGWEIALHYKVSFQKKRRSGRKDAELSCRGILLASGLGRVALQPLKNGEIIEKAAAADFCQAAAGVRPVDLVALGVLPPALLLPSLNITATAAVFPSADL